MDHFMSVVLLFSSVDIFLLTFTFMSRIQYSKVEQKAIGTYQFTLKNNTMDPPQLCKRFYRQGSIFAFNESFNFDPTIDHGMLVFGIVLHCNL